MNSENIIQNSKSPQAKHGRVYAFDFIRVYSCLMVILLHTESTWKSDAVGSTGYYAMGVGGVAFNAVVVTLLVRIAVPMFFMMSGVLFLNPSHDVSLASIAKHIRKILVLLCLFGYAFALMEIAFVNRQLGLSDFGAAFLNLLQEKTWSHLWFLYVIVGLYILTPVLRAWIKSASPYELRIGAAFAIVLLSVIPTINNCMGLRVTTFSITSTGSGLLYYLAGYFLSISPPPEKVAYFDRFNTHKRTFWLFGIQTDYAFRSFRVGLSACGRNILSADA